MGKSPHQPARSAPAFSGSRAQDAAGRVAIALVFGLLALLAIRQIASPDIGFHLAAGERILDGDGWPDLDPFTYTATDRPYIDTSWGYQATIALIQRAAGAPGLILFHASLVLAIFGIMLRTIRLVLLLGGLASEMRFEPRPELISYLLLAVLLHLLHRRAEGLAAPLWLLVPIHMLWANLHGLFVLGWAAIGCFAIGLALRERRLDRRLAGWGAASVAAVLVNPYGWRGAVFPLVLATRLDPGNIFAQSIGEFTSPFALRLSEQFPFYPRLPIFSFRLLAVASLLALIPALRRRRFWCAALWLAFMAIAYRMIRNIPPFVIAALPWTAWGAAALAASRPSGRPRPRLLAWTASVVAAVAILVGIRVIHDAHYLDSRRAERFGLGWNRDVLPVEATAFAGRAALPGRVLNHLNFGGWLIWAGSGQVHIDGRLEVIGEELFDSYRETLASTEALERAVARHGIGWIIFPHAFNPDLLGRLSRDARWDLAYADGVATIFVRKGLGWSGLDPAPGPTEVGARATPGDPSVIGGRSASPPGPAAVPGLPGPVVDRAAVARPVVAPPFALLPGLGGPERSGPWQRRAWSLARRSVFPEEEYGLGLFHLYRGELAAAEARFSRGIAASDGAWYEIYNNLGAVLWRMRRHAEARRCYAIVLEEDPRNRVARERLDMLTP
jgi:hypothetical protein